MLGKKSSEKSEKNVFLYSHKIVTKNGGGEKRAKQFIQKHTNSARKNIRKKIVGKKCEKHFFYIHTNIETKKWGEKTCETIFPDTHE